MNMPSPLGLRVTALSVEGELAARCRMILIGKEKIT